VSGTAASTATSTPPASTTTTKPTTAYNSFVDDGDRGDIDPNGGGNGVDNDDHPNNQCNNKNNDVDNGQDEDQTLPTLLSEFPSPPFLILFIEPHRKADPAPRKSPRRL
jgi:hypothetical protein